MELNYQELVDNYQKNLDTKLRGFKGGPGFLETWTYDVDDQRSLLEIIELGSQAGEEIIVINVSQEIADKFVMGGWKDGFLGVVGTQVQYHSQRALKFSQFIKRKVYEYGYRYDVELVRLKGNILTLDYEEKEPQRPLHFHLMTLERELNKEFNEKIDIQTLNVDDKNRRQCRLSTT